MLNITTLQVKKAYLGGQLILHLLPSIKLYFKKALSVLVYEYVHFFDKPEKPQLDSKVLILYTTARCKHSNRRLQITVDTKQGNLKHNFDCGLSLSPTRYLSQVKRFLLLGGTLLELKRLGG